MLIVHPQITSLKDLPFRYEGQTVGYATNEGLSWEAVFQGEWPPLWFLLHI